MFYRKKSIWGIIQFFISEYIGYIDTKENRTLIKKSFLQLIGIILVLGVCCVACGKDTNGKVSNAITETSVPSLTIPLTVTPTLTPTPTTANTPTPTLAPTTTNTPTPTLVYDAYMSACATLQSEETVYINRINAAEVLCSETSLDCIADPSTLDSLNDCVKKGKEYVKFCYVEVSKDESESRIWEELDKVNQNLATLKDESNQLYLAMEAVKNSKEKWELAEKERKANSGIVIVRVIERDPLNWNSTGTYAVTPFTVNIHLINPEDGSYRLIHSFSSEETKSCSHAVVLGSTPVTKQNFTDDYTKMTAQKTMENGEKHVGWIDKDGKFTDVTSMVVVPNDFAPTTEHISPRFFGEYFYFIDASEKDGLVKRVPINQLKPDKVEVIHNLGIYKYIDLAISPDGTVDGNYSDESREYKTGWGHFYEWVSKSSYLEYTYSGKIALVYLKNKLKANGLSEEEKTEYIVPDVNKRINIYPVMSPDGKQVAFLSGFGRELMDYSLVFDDSLELFVVSLDGGYPEKVNTDCSLPGVKYDYCNYAILEWR